MVDSVKKQSKIHKRNKILLIFFVAILLLGIFRLSRHLQARSFYFNYFGIHQKNGSVIKYEVPKVVVDPSKKELNIETRAIPVIYYHGILEDSAADGINVTKSNFLDQMVKLKREGYYTIDSGELADFYAGKKFYGKPIVITFDDGRVDSYTYSDDIFKKLGFKATLFVVTGKQDNYTDPFFLSWQQLEALNDSGRWDLQPHGWYSHTKVSTDSSGNKSDALTNRKWLPGQMRLESVQEATNRIEADYDRSNSDLKAHFPNLTNIAYALPYGDYGQKENNFGGNPTAKDVNDKICRQKYKICYVIDDQGYNFKVHDPYKTERIEVLAGWTGDILLAHMDNNAPNSPNFEIDFTKNSLETIELPTQLLGLSDDTQKGLKLISRATDRYMNLNIGNENSYNYSISSSYTVNQASSVYLSGYKYDDHQHSQDVLYGMTGSIANLYIIKDGQKQTLKSELVANFDPIILHILKMSLHGTQVKCYLDGVQVFNTNVPVFEPRGTYGYDDYGPSGVDVIYKDLSLTSTGR